MHYQVMNVAARQKWLQDFTLETPNGQGQQGGEQGTHKAFQKQGKYVRPMHLMVRLQVWHSWWRAWREHNPLFTKLSSSPAQ